MPTLKKLIEQRDDADAAYAIGAPEVLDPDQVDEICGQAEAVLDWLDQVEAVLPARAASELRRLATDVAEETATVAELRELSPLVEATQDALEKACFDLDEAIGVEE